MRDAPAMINWTTLDAAAPDIAAAGRRLIFRTDVGEALLASVRDGEPPRIHPIYVAILDGRLYSFIIRSPKRTDYGLDNRLQTTSGRSHPC
jgi:hypothetical protein